LRALVAGGADEGDLKLAAERVRDARLLALKSVRANGSQPSIAERRIAALREQPIEEILREFGCRPELT
jgi:hypothetical protein